ncbi:MAG: GIY-YIG nuclease family protein [Veillonella sp.]|nr:GIY-YIG nuclease family protein [Veillonella sp.]
MDQEQFFTYIVRCADESLYCGWTTDIKKRLDAHNGVIKGGAKYTKCRRPVYLVYHESFQSKQEAQSREYAIKHRTYKSIEIECTKHSKRPLFVL